MDTNEEQGAAASMGERLDHDYHKMQRMYEALPDPVLFVNKQGVITKVNERTVRFFGLERKMLVGQNVTVLMPERFRKSHEGHISHYFLDPETRPMGLNLDIIALQDGGQRETPVTIMLAPLVTGNETEAIAVIRRKVETGRPAVMLLEEIRDYCLREHFDAPFLAQIDRLLPVA